MAGDWIKLEVSTPDKPEIDQMAKALNLDHDSVVGKCVRLWIWADQQSVDGNGISVTESLLDRVTYCKGFASALRQVGWLTGREGRLSIPNFDRHNGQTAKNRALTSKRVKKSRNAPSVTESLLEKRREEKSSISISGASEIVIPAKINTPEARQAADMWFAHLDVSYPDKVPPPNSPQLQAFWNAANRMGPEKFVAAVEYTVASGWANLRERPEQETKGNQRGSNRSAAQSREQANADAFDAFDAIAASQRARNEAEDSGGFETALLT
jgi:hypothetical protein